MRVFMAIKTDDRIGQIAGVAIVDEWGGTIYASEFAKEGNETNLCFLRTQKSRFSDVTSVVVYDMRTVGTFARMIFHRKAIIQDAMVKAGGRNEPLSQVMYEIGLPPFEDDLVSEAQAIRSVWRHFSGGDGDGKAGDAQTPEASGDASAPRLVEKVSLEAHPGKTESTEADQDDFAPDFTPAFAPDDEAIARAPIINIVQADHDADADADDDPDAGLPELDTDLDTLIAPAQPKAHVFNDPFAEFGLPPADEAEAKGGGDETDAPVTPGAHAPNHSGDRRGEGQVLAPAPSKIDDTPWCDAAPARNPVESQTANHAPSASSQQDAHQNPTSVKTSKVADEPSMVAVSRGASVYDDKATRREGSVQTLSHALVGKIDDKAALTAEETKAAGGDAGGQADSDVAATPRKRRVAGVLGGEGGSTWSFPSLGALLPGKKTLAAVGVAAALGIGFLAGRGLDPTVGSPQPPGQPWNPSATTEPSWLSSARSGTISGAPVPVGGQDGWAVIRSGPQLGPDGAVQQPKITPPRFAPLPQSAQAIPSTPTGPDRSSLFGERVPDALPIDRGDKRVCDPELLFGRWLVVDQQRPYIAGYLPPVQRYKSFASACGQFTVNDVTRVAQGPTVDLTSETSGPGGMTMCLAYQDRAVDEMWTWTRMLSGYVVRKGGAVRIFGNPGNCRAW